MSCVTPVPETPSPPPPSPTYSNPLRLSSSPALRPPLARLSLSSELRPSLSPQRRYQSPTRARIIRRSQRLFGHQRSKSLPNVRTNEFAMTKACTTNQTHLVPSGPTAPSEQEILGYYLGLDSQPRLVARTSTEPWRHRSDQGQILYKTLDYIGKHPIIALWNHSAGPLRHRTLQVIDRLKWTAVNILRLGYERLINDPNVPLGPVTMLISVKHESTSWSLGLSIALDCREILQQHGVFDIHVEVKESLTTRTALQAHAPSTAPRLSSPSQCLLPRSNKDTILLTESLGVSMASLQSPDVEGTKGLYLRHRDTGATILLTCRHMVFDKSENVDYRH